MNKNILKYIPMLMALLMVSCSSDDTLEGVNPSAEITSGIADDNHEATVIMGGYEDCHASQNESLTRSSFVYDRIDNLMKFSWKADDKVGVFYKGNNNTQVTFVLDGFDQQQNSAYSVIKLSDANVDYQMKPTDGYVSYIPYKEQNIENGKFTYEAVPVTFLGQQQKANVKMNCYRHRDVAEQAKAYHDSEADACAHLGDYNYQVSDVISTPSAHVHFNYHAVSTVVRFFITVPSKLYYDSLQVVNNKASFMREGTMNVLNGEFTPSKESKESHVMSLVFNPSIDMTEEDNMYWNDSNHSGYLMAYMMIAPINLNQTNIDKSTLYLCGHEKGTNTKHYYRAELSKINFLGGKHYQWAPVPGSDEPITFEEVTVQTWTSHVYNNNGAGTESW